MELTEHSKMLVIVPYEGNPASVLLWRREYNDLRSAVQSPGHLLHRVGTHETFCKRLVITEPRQNDSTGFEMRQYLSGASVYGRCFRGSIDNDWKAYMYVTCPCPRCFINGLADDSNNLQFYVVHECSAGCPSWWIREGSYAVKPGLENRLEHITDCGRMEEVVRYLFKHNQRQTKYKIGVDRGTVSW